MSVVVKGSVVIQADTDEEADALLRDIGRMNQAKQGGPFISVVELTREAE